MMKSIELVDEDSNTKNLEQFGDSRVYIYDNPKFDPEKIWNRIKSKFKRVKRLIKDTDWYKNKERKKIIPLMMWVVK